MRRLAAALALASAASTPVAAAEVDPRYAYTVELSGSAGVGGEFSQDVKRSTSFNPLIRLGFFAPVAEDVKLGGTLFGSGSELGVAGGVRFLTDAEPWQTRLDAQLAATVRPRLGFGLRIGAGVARVLWPGLRAGVEVAGSFLAVRNRFDFEPALFVSWSW